MQTAARLFTAPFAVRASGLRWLLARAWCLLLGARLGRALRSALGGSPAPAAPGPPVRPRRPRRAGRLPVPYPRAA